MEHPHEIPNPLENDFHEQSDPDVDYLADDARIAVQRRCERRTGWPRLQAPIASVAAQTVYDNGFAGGTLQDNPVG